MGDRNDQGRSTMSVVAVVVALALLIPPAAHADAGFAPPVDLPWVNETTGVEVVTGTPGEAIVAGTQRIDPGGNPPYRPTVSILGAGASDASLQELADVTNSGVALAANRSGEALAAWSDVPRPVAKLRLAVREPGQPFGSAIDVNEGTGDVFSIRTAMNRGGDAVVVYEFLPWNGTPELRAVFRPAGGTVGPPVVIAQLPRDASLAGEEVAIDAHGSATVAWYTWTRSDSPDTRVRVAWGDRVSGFGQAQVIDSKPILWSNLHLGVDADGAGVLLWAETGDSPSVSDVTVARRVPGGGFGEPVVIGESIASDQGRWEQMDLAVSGGGRVTAAWVDGRYVRGRMWTHIVSGTTRGTTLEPIADTEPPPLPDPNSTTGPIPESPAVFHFPKLAAAWDGTTLFAGEGSRRGPQLTLNVAFGTAEGVLGSRHDAACPPITGQPERVAVGGPDDAVVLLRRPEYIGASYVLARSIPGSPAGPDDCDPPSPPDGTPWSTGPADGPDPSQARLRLFVPRSIRARALGRLPVSVSSTASGELGVRGTFVRSGHRVTSFKTQRWLARGPSKRRVLLRLARPRAVQRKSHVVGRAIVWASIRTGAGVVATKVARVTVRR